MPAGNVERLRSILERWLAHRELGPGELAEDVEWVNPPDAVEGGRRHGIDGFNAAIASVFDAWDEARFEVERMIDRGADVVALGQVRARGRGAGVEVCRPHGEIWTFSAGKVIRMRWFHSHDETLEAAGLGA